MGILPKNYLAPGERLNQGDYLQSTNRKFYAAIGTDGDFCVFAGTPMNCQGIGFRAGIPGSGSRFVTMETGGNFCLYTGGAQAPAWSIAGQGPTSFAIMQDDGNFCIYAGSSPKNQGAGRWDDMSYGGSSTNLTPLSDTLSAGQQLFPGTYIPSAGGKFFLTIVDGDLCVYAGTPTNCQGLSWKFQHPAPLSYAIMQDNGDFVLWQGTPAAPGGFANFM
ncbi:MAG: hypothetical protein K2X44_12840, partial [Magnetospirillum sp.]|nr:hypothetical protein [Magnetospirillum sp.]